MNYDAYKIDGPDPLNTNSSMDFLSQLQADRHQGNVGALQAAAAGVAAAALVGHFTQPQAPQQPVQGQYYTDAAPHSYNYRAALIWAAIILGVVIAVAVS